jgi:2-oxo-4-hydroxy-4-carboxy--5-ureidoimidazoline (OHCU) decarboxylase
VYAAQTLARAEHAETTTNQARAGLAQLQQAEQEAWQAYENAYQRAAYARTRVAQEQQTATAVAAQAAPDEQARDLISHAAYEAHRRGDLSTVELQAVMQRVGGHAPLIDVLQRDAVRRSAATTQARTAFERAAAAARAAAEHLRVAEVAENACMQEAVQAAIEAQQALAAVPQRARATRMAIGPGGGTST